MLAFNERYKAPKSKDLKRYLNPVLRLIIYTNYCSLQGMFSSQNNPEKTAEVECEDFYNTGDRATVLMKRATSGSLEGVMMSSMHLGRCDPEQKVSLSYASRDLACPDISWCTLVVDSQTSSEPW